MIVLHVLFGLMILVGTILTGISFQGDTQKLTKLQKFSLIFTTSAIGLTVIAVISISSSVYLGIALIVILAVYEYFSFLRQTN